MPIRTSHWLYAFLAFVVLLLLWGTVGYNGLVTGREQVNASWAQVETQYQRRVDLVPNLVSTVKGAAKFEQDTFIAITEARSQWQSAPNKDRKIAAAENLDSALGRLLVTVEAYPQLQATQAFRDLMAQLEGTENRIAVARKDYNEAVQNYNLRTKRFPGSLLAGLFHFTPEKFFENQPGAENAPVVNFGS